MTTDFVVVALRRRRAAFCRLNTEDLIRTWRIAWRTSGWTANDTRGRTIDSSSVQSTYYRRPQAANPVDGTADDAGVFAMREAGALLRGLIAHTKCHWISLPAAIEAAEDKLLQLRTAESLGFTIPRTIVTNDPEQARAFISSVSMAIVKPLSSGHLSDDPLLLAYTAPVASDDDLAAVALAPHLIQERVQKVADVRVTVVGGRLFACRIKSQKHTETSLDWRTASSRGILLDHELMTLPEQIESACISLVRSLNLRFGAIDLVERHDGFTFLEINPNGQWAWIEQRTGAPISEALADELIGSSVSWSA